MEAKLSWGKGPKKANFCQLFEQKVDLKSKTLDFRHLGIFQNPRFCDKSPNLVTLITTLFSSPFELMLPAAQANKNLPKCLTKVKQCDKT